MKQFITKLLSDLRGSMVIETAMVAPTLIMMTIGVFEVGRMVARQHELQSAANEAEIIILSTNGGAVTNVDTIKSIIMESVDLSASEVSISQSYRCGTDVQIVNILSLCLDDDVVSTYINIDITETYEPVWTIYGVGNPITFSVERSVLIS